MPHTQHCPQCSEKVPGGSRFCQACGSSITPERHSPRVNRPKKAGRSNRFLAGAVVLAVVLVAAVFGFTRLSASDQPTLAGTSAERPLAEVAGPVPQWLASAPAAVVADYTWAASHHNELQYFPCFCGCNKSAGHVSNSDCYYTRDGKGAIRGYDQHAYG